MLLYCLFLLKEHDIETDLQCQKTNTQNHAAKMFPLPQNPVLQTRKSIAFRCQAVCPQHSDRIPMNSTTIYFVIIGYDQYQWSGYHQQHPGYYNQHNMMPGPYNHHHGGPGYPPNPYHQSPPGAMGQYYNMGPPGPHHNADLMG